MIQKPPRRIPSGQATRIANWASHPRPSVPPASPEFGTPPRSVSRAETSRSRWIGICAVLQLGAFAASREIPFSSPGHSLLRRQRAMKRRERAVSRRGRAMLRRGRAMLRPHRFMSRRERKSIFCELQSQLASYSTWTLILVLPGCIPASLPKRMSTLFLPSFWTSQ